jgi:hypothetical protein
MELILREKIVLFLHKVLWCLINTAFRGRTGMCDMVIYKQKFLWKIMLVRVSLMRCVQCLCDSDVQTCRHKFMFFVPCSVIQLCNVNAQMHTFQINVLIQSLVSSACFKHRVFIIRKTICISIFLWYVLLTLMDEKHTVMPHEVIVWPQLYPTCRDTVDCVSVLNKFLIFWVWLSLWYPNYDLYNLSPV